MAYPVNGLKGKITSWGDSGKDVFQLIGTAIRPVEFTISANSDVQDITPLDGDNAALEYMGGLFDGTFDFSGLWPQTAPVLGNTGLLTLASSYDDFVEAWSLSLDWGEEDITSFPAVGGARRFMPKGLLDWGGSFTARQSSGSAITLPTAANGLGEAATFKLKETTTADAGFTGNIVVASFTERVAPREQIKVQYNFKGTGSLTSVEGTTGGPAILPAGVLDMPDWDSDGDGVPDITVVLQAFTGRTFTAAAFLRSLQIECNVGQPIRVSGTGRFSDAVTPA